MRVTRFIYTVIKPYWIYLVGAIAAMFLHAASAACRPYIMRYMINTAALGRAPIIIDHLWHAVGYFVLMQFLIHLARRFSEWCTLKYEPPLRNYAVKLCFEHALLQDHTYFQNNFAGGLGARVGDIAKAVPLIISIFITYFMINFFAVIVAAISLSHAHHWFVIALSVWVAFLGVLIYLTAERATRLSNKSADAAANVIGAIVDSIANILSVRLSAAREIELYEIGGMQKIYLSASNKRRWHILRFYTYQALSFFAYQAICLCMLVHLYGKGEVTGGDFALILSTNLWIMESMWQMSDQMRHFTEHWGTAGQALSVLFAPHHGVDRKNAHELVAVKGEIVFEKVRFSYNEKSAPLFKDKSIVIKSGEKIGLVGYSGAGKTTFINLILRLYEVSEGRIFIDSQDIMDCTQDSLRRNIGVITQDSSLFNRTILENIRYGRPEATFDEVVAAAKAAHAHTFIQRLEKGYNTMAGERGGNLSGGQRQRIMIARAFLKNAPILILDEATSQLDSLTEIGIQESLTDLMRGKTTIAIAHRLSTILHMDRIFVFDNGHIVDQGSHDELMTRGGLYQTLWQTQAGGFIADGN